MAHNVVSIIMPMYNSARYVADAIESVFRQDYPDFELIVIDDGSTDCGHEVVQQYSDPRIRLIRTENKGQSAARNRGVAESRGAYVTFLDSDDLLTPTALSSRLIALLQTGENVVFSRNIITVDISSEIELIKYCDDIGRNFAWTVWKADDLISMLVEGSFFVFPQAFIIERALFQSIGGFDRQIRAFEDVEFISRVLPAAQRLLETTAPFYVYRRRRDSVSSLNSRRKAGEALRALQQSHRNLAPYLVGREDQVAQSLFGYCVQAYPYWTREHRRAMVKACCLRGDRPFDLSCVGGSKAQAIAKILGWRAGRLANFTRNHLKYNTLRHFPHKS